MSGQSKVTQKSLRTGKTVIRLIRYAAILIIGFGVSFAVNRIIHKKPGDGINPDEYSTVNVAYGSKSTIQLPDGSAVNLNSGTTIKYATQFGLSDRTVILEGEGFFTVNKDAGHPFYVKTRQIIIKAVGTSFNVRSYKDEDITETTLVTGSVEIYSNNQNHLPDEQSVKLAVLHPNQKAVISNDDFLISESRQPQEKKKIISPDVSSVTIQNKISTELFTEWRNNILVFDNEKFVDIIRKLERWYNVEITLKYKALSDIRFSGKFDRESIEDVLNGLKMIQSFDYEIHKNKIVIY